MQKKESLFSQNNFKQNCFEKKAWLKNQFVCGIDEVGRGSLSGPLVVAAVILHVNAKHKYLKDSKTIDEHRREEVYRWIIKNSFFSTVFVDVHHIDKLNIYRATNKAMKRSYVQLLEKFRFKDIEIKYIIVDAMPIDFDKIYKHKNLKIYHPNHAESLSISVAAASIVAKVTRDRFMKKLSFLFPRFSFEQHKGYGTKLHINAIENYGTSIVHRSTFVTRLQVISDVKQKNIF